MSYLFKYAGSWGGKKLQQIKRNKYLNKQICLIDIPRQFRALSQKKAFFQDTKGHNSVINRWCTMPFGVHHPLIHIYTHNKFQWNLPKQFQDMAPDTKVPERWTYTTLYYYIPFRYFILARITRALSQTWRKNPHAALTKNILHVVFTKKQRTPCSMFKKPPWTSFWPSMAHVRTWPTHHLDTTSDQVWWISDDNYLN